MYNQRCFISVWRPRPGVTDMLVENTTWLHFRLNHWKTWHLMFHFHLCMNLWANQARLFDTCKHLFHKRTSLGRFEVFFVSEWLCGVLQVCLHTKKKLLCKSHSSLNSEWWAVLTLMPGSEQSLAHIFQEICDSCCGERLFVSPWLLCSSSLLSLLTGACCSFHATQFFKCYHSIVDPGILNCNLALILTQPDLYFSQKIPLSRTMQYIL